MQVAGKTVIVSGGASGLGAAVADMVVAQGGRVAILDLDAGAGRAQAARLGERAGFFQADVVDAAHTEAAFAAVTAAFGAVHGAVCTAGIAVAERVISRDGIQPLDHFSRVVAVNLVGTFNVVRLAAGLMAANEPGPGGERGVIVMTSSIAAYEGQVGQAAYAASKGGIVGMTLPLARELARIGIRVMTIAPGTFDTPLLAALPQGTLDSLAQQVPFPSRLGRPEEFASLVRHILENEMLNGETIRLDGATRMTPK